MTTTADENRDKAKEHIKEALKSITAITVEECWGSEDYSATYLVQLMDAVDLLQRAKMLL